MDTCQVRGKYRRFDLKRRSSIKINQNKFKNVMSIMAESLCENWLLNTTESTPETMSEKRTIKIQSFVMSSIQYQNHSLLFKLV